MDLIERVYHCKCSTPLKIKHWDFISQCYVIDEVPCGNCHHCRMSKVSDWITRLTAHAKYHKFVYFVTLTFREFSSKTPSCLIQETNSVCHNININHRFQLSPLTLNKSILQKFFKRLRKSGHKFSYFAVGEYGHKFGRPHYHIILYSQNEISKLSLYKAWSLQGYVFGNIDCQNLYQNGTLNADSGKNAFNYVCKYMFKRFNFDDLPTIKYLNNLLLNSYKYEKNIDLFQEIKVSDIKKDAKFMASFYKRYGNFSLCSKRPFIGSQYFYENVERFKARDYRLFGLSDRLSFPRFYKRKIKEEICPFKIISSVNQTAVSSSHIPSLVSLLRSFIFNKKNLFFTLFADGKDGRFNLGGTLIVNGQSIKLSYLNLYDINNNVYYVWRGLYYYVFRRERDKDVILGKLSWEDVINIISSPIRNLYSYVLINNQSMEFSKCNLNKSIITEYGSIDNFNIQLNRYIKMRESIDNDLQQKYLSSKILF